MLGAVDGHVAAGVAIGLGSGGVSGDLAGQDLSLHSGLNLAASVGVQDVVVLGHILDGVEIVVSQGVDAVGQTANGSGQSGDSHSALALVVVAGGLHQIGVGHGDGDQFLVGVRIHLGQHALAALAGGGGGVGLSVGGGDGDLVGHLHTVNEQIQTIVVHHVLAQQVVQVVLAHLGGVGGGGGIGVGANGSGLVGPAGAGTAEVVAAILVHLQIALIQLLAQLHDPGAGVDNSAGGGQALDGAGIGLAAGDEVVADLTSLNLDAVGVDLDGVVVGLNSAGLQGVQHQLSQVVAGHGLDDAGLHIDEQVDLVGLLDGGELPVILKVGLELEVTQGLHQHQSGLGSGDRLVTAVGGGADTGSDAVGVAGGYIGFSPCGDIGKGAGALVVGYAVVHQVGHDHGHLITGDQCVGVEVAVLVAGHNTDFLENFDGFLILLGRHIVVGRAGADYHQAHDHDGSQSQAKGPLQVSHSGFLLKFFGPRTCAAFRTISQLTAFRPGTRNRRESCPFLCRPSAEALWSAPWQRSGAALRPVSSREPLFYSGHC